MKGHEETREMEGVGLQAWKCLILEAGTKKPSGVRGPFAKDLNEGRDWPQMSVAVHSRREEQHMHWPF